MTYGKQDNREKDYSAQILKYATPYHAPVLWESIVRLLVQNPSGVFVDATAGGGGLTKAILDALNADGRVFGIDRDEDALNESRRRLADDLDVRLTLIRGSFADMAELIEEAGVGQVDGILFDLGLSSHQINNPERGFAFDSDGPLDMRMDRDLDLDASLFINSATHDEIRRVLRTYGDEPKAGRISRAIVEQRPMESTRQLADVIRRIVPYADTARTLSRVFQAVRIAVNDEMNALESALVAAADLVKPGGRLAVLSYQSGEDRRVKRMMRFGNFEGTVVRDLYGNTASPWQELTRKPIMPTDAEKQQNPRSRSARLRVAERRADQMKGAAIA